jgi:hypothetical protein
VIYIVTVHHETDRWIPLQARSVGRWLPEARVVAVSDWPAPGHFYRRLSSKDADVGFLDRPRVDSNHAHRLDRLVQEVLTEALADDVLITLDSDALLIADPRPLLARLDDLPLIAVCRDREATEAWRRHQPHPSFSAMRVATWLARGCTWKPTTRISRDTKSLVNAAGGQLLEVFGDTWLKLRRVNRVNPHYLMIALYGEDGAEPVVYHHGAGSRVPLFAIDKAAPRAQWPGRIQNNQALSETWFTRAADPDFWRALMGEAAHV